MLSITLLAPFRTTVYGAASAGPRANRRDARRTTAALLMRGAASTQTRPARAQTGFLGLLSLVTSFAQLPARRDASFRRVRQDATDLQRYVDGSYRLFRRRTSTHS